MASPIVEVLTKGIGELNLRDIEVYRKTGGYVQLERAIALFGTARTAVNHFQRENRAFQRRLNVGVAGRRNDDPRGKQRLPFQQAHDLCDGCRSALRGDDNGDPRSGAARLRVLCNHSG